MWHIALPEAVDRDGALEAESRGAGAAAASACDDAACLRSCLETILDSTGDAVFCATLDWRIVRWPPAAERMFETAGEPMAGRSLWMLVAAEERDERSCAAQRVLHGERVTAQWRVLRRAGGAKRLSVTLSPVVDEASGVIGVAAIARDESELGRVRQALLQSRNALEAATEERSRLATFFDAAADAMYGESPAGAVVSWNRAAQRTFGIAAREMIGRPAASLIPAHRREHDLAMVARAVAGERVAPFASTRLRKGGGEVGVLVSLATVRNAAGAPTGVCTIARDQAESARIRHELTRARAAADAANEELEAFAYSVAHDFRSFARTIDAYSQVLVRDCEDRLGDGGRESLRLVRDASRSISRLSNDVLVLARATRNALERTPIDLSALARAVVARLSRQNPERDVEVRIADGLHAECDSQLLMLVFENLIGNAWKFTAGQERARLQVGAIERQGTRAYFVSDNGAGFDSNGLGLATVKRIVRRHGGRVWFESAADTGATVYFTLGPAASVA